MATMCRKERKVNIKNLAILISILSLVLVLISVSIGYLIGKLSTENQVIEVEKIVEVEKKTPKFYKTYDIPLSVNLQKHIIDVCEDKDVPVELILAIIQTESDFNQEVVSNTNDYGLMQINEVNLDMVEDKYRAGDMLNPYQNVYCGISIFSNYYHKYEDIHQALMSYNMGEYGMNKAYENGINSTTYSNKIVNLYEEYKNGK